ncbi:aldehyde dehydrogenase [Mycena pura]|uniref:Aldehyde dehydrogenase n=1 Tax=Mycena pura TaxID=153505 RepID=A0AAD6YBH0_9AGAR|nr:aldehyde dehydrogenase [Mycena pura]
MTTPISEIPTIRKALGESFSKGVPRPLEWRKHQLLQLQRMLQENRDTFTEALEKDLAKPKLENYGHELGGAMAQTVLAAEGLVDWNRPVVVETPDWQKSWKPTVHRAGKGTVVILAPWNYPIALVLQPLAGAIAAGCCAVLKPSEITPHCGEALAELIPKYLDTRAYRVVLGSVPETTALLELQWDHIFYTGNNRVARIIAAAAAKHLTPLTLELGGKSAVIVDPAYDLTLAAKRILWGKALNCGQAHQFVVALEAAYAEFFPEGSMKSQSIPRIVSPQHHHRLMDLLNRTRGKVIIGGNSEGKTKIEVTVIRDVRADDSLMDDYVEIFGPLLPIVPVDSIDAAIEFVRAREHALALYTFTENLELKQKIQEQTMSGAAVFGDTVMQQTVANLPFGGIGQSGYGRQTGKATFDAFSYERTSIDVSKEFEQFNAARYPPYTEEKLKALVAASTAA